MFRWTMDETAPRGEVIDHAQTQSMDIGDDSTSTDRATTPAARVEEAGWIPLPDRDHAQHLTLPAPVHWQELAAGDEQLHLRLGRAAENDDGRNALVDLQRARQTAVQISVACDHAGFVFATPASYCEHQEARAGVDLAVAQSDVETSLVDRDISYLPSAENLARIRAWRAEVPPEPEVLPYAEWEEGEARDDVGPHVLVRRLDCPSAPNELPSQVQLPAPHILSTVRDEEHDWADEDGMIFASHSQHLGYERRHGVDDYLFGWPNVDRNHGATGQWHTFNNVDYQVVQTWLPYPDFAAGHEEGHHESQLLSNMGDQLGEEFEEYVAEEGHQHYVEVRIHGDEQWTFLPENAPSTMREGDSASEPERYLNDWIEFGV